MTAFSKVTDFLTTSWLQAQAGKRAYDRGGAYYHANTVSKLEDTGPRLSGRVQGANEYDAAIWLEHDEPKYACTCDEGSGGAFCKHLVALGLTLLAHRQDRHPSSGEFSGYRSLSAMQRYLQTLPKDALVNLVLDQAQQREEFGQALSVQALRAGYADASALENLVQRALRFEPHSALGRDRLRRLQRVAELLEALAQGGQTNLARELAGAAIARAGKGSDVDDVVGRLTKITAAGPTSRPMQDS